MAQCGLNHRKVQTGASLAAGLLLAGSLASAYANGPHPIRKDEYKHQVEHLEEVWRTAQLNDDVDTMDKLLSDDYVGITMTGQVVTKMQQLDRMKNRTTVLNKIALDDVKVKLIGSTAIVQARAEIDGTNDGAPIHGMYRYTRVYSRLPTGVWKITNFEATRVGAPPGERPGHASAQNVPPKPE
jgi:ketosteroid isomerase-like protein